MSDETQQNERKIPRRTLLAGAATGAAASVVAGHGVLATGGTAASSSSCDCAYVPELFSASASDGARRALSDIVRQYPHAARPNPHH